MINHARTLLLNVPVDKAATSPTDLGEYVDPAFVPLGLDPGLTAYRRAWLGADEEPRYRNIQLRRMAAVIAADRDISRFVESLDPRNTVDLSRREPFIDENGGKHGDGYEQGG